MASASPEPPRYLYARTHTHIGKGGLDYGGRLLRLHLATAMALGRTAVLAPLRLCEQHNQGHPSDCDPRRYFDLDAATYGGRPIPYVMASELDMNQFAPHEIKEVRPFKKENYRDSLSFHTASHADGENHRLVVFDLTPIAYPIVDEEPVCLEAIRKIRLEYSPSVRARAQRIIQLLLVGGGGRHTRHQRA